LFYIREFEWEGGKMNFVLNVMLPSTFLFLCKHCLFWFSAQIKLTVQGLFDLNQNIPAFKEHLRDFMVQIKVGDLNE